MESHFYQQQELSPEECREARAHWLALMFAPSSSQLAAARQKLKAAAPSIQQAVTGAIVRLWREGKKAEHDHTPFDEGC